MKAEKKTLLETWWKVHYIYIYIYIYIFIYLFICVISYFRMREAIDELKGLIELYGTPGTNMRNMATLEENWTCYGIRDNCAPKARCYLTTTICQTLLLWQVPGGTWTKFVLPKKFIISCNCKARPITKLASSAYTSPSITLHIFASQKKNLFFAWNSIAGSQVNRHMLLCSVNKIPHIYMTFGFSKCNCFQKK